MWPGLLPVLFSGYQKLACQSCNSAHDAMENINDAFVFLWQVHPIACLICGGGSRGKTLNRFSFVKSDHCFFFPFIQNYSETWCISQATVLFISYSLGSMTYLSTLTIYCCFSIRQSVFFQKPACEFSFFLKRNHFIWSKII